MKRCEKCSTMNEDSVSFCTNCGSSLGAPISAPEFTAAPVAPAAPAKKSVDGKFIALIAVAVIGIIVGVVGVVFALNANKDTKKDEGNKPETAEVKPPVEEEGGGETVAVSGNNEGTTVSVGPYKVTIPKDIAYDTSDGNLVVGGSNWAAHIFYGNDATFHCIYTDIASLGTHLTSQGYGNVKTGVSKAGGLDYAYADFLDPKSGAMMTISYFKAGQYYFESVSTDTTKTANHTVLNDVARVLSTAKEGKVRELGLGLDDLGTTGISKDLVKNADLKDRENTGETEE